MYIYSIYVLRNNMLQYYKNMIYKICASFSHYIYSV